MPASPAGREAARRLWGAALDALARERGGEELVREITGDQSNSALERALLEECGGLFLGAYAGTPCGIAYARPALRPGAATLALLYVEEGFRRVGVGEELLAAVERWCAANGCAALDVPVLPGGRGAKSLLEQRGYLARLIVMERPIDPGPDR